MTDHEIAIRIVALIDFLKELFTPKPKIPEGARYDFEKYYQDIDDLGIFEAIEKDKRGEYWTTGELTKSWTDLPLETVVDVERYERDKILLGELWTESNRKAGDYRWMDYCRMPRSERRNNGR